MFFGGNPSVKEAAGPVIDGIPGSGKRLRAEAVRETKGR